MLSHHHLIHPPQQYTHISQSSHIDNRRYKHTHTTLCHTHTSLLPSCRLPPFGFRVGFLVGFPFPLLSGFPFGFPLGFPWVFRSALLLAFLVTFLLASSRSVILVSPKVNFGRFLGASHFDDLLAIGPMCFASLMSSSRCIRFIRFSRRLEGLS